MMNIIRELESDIIICWVMAACKRENTRLGLT